MTETTSSSLPTQTDTDKTLPAPFVSQVALALERAAIEMERDMPMGIQRDLDATLYAQCDFFARFFQRYADKIETDRSNTGYYFNYICASSDRFRASYNLLNNMQLERERIKLYERRLDAQDNS